MKKQCTPSPLKNINTLTPTPTTTPKPTPMPIPTPTCFGMFNEGQK